MKKVLFILVTFIVIISTSCEKDEITAPMEVSMEQVKVFTSKSNDGGLKSASAALETIKPGDTIRVTRNVHRLMWTENELGQPIKCKWTIELVVSELSLLQKTNDYYKNYSLKPVIEYYNGDQVTPIFSEFGVYKITLEKINEPGKIVTTFYAKVFGIPGKTGDGEDNNFIFRVERKKLIHNTLNEEMDVVFIYYKYATTPKPDQASMAMANFTGYMYPKTLFFSFNSHKVTKWPFFHDDYYFDIMPTGSSNLRCEIIFCHGTTSQNRGLSEGIADANVALSSFADYVTPGKFEGSVTQGNEIGIIFANQ